MNRPPRYVSPELPPPAALAEVTRKYKQANDERAARLAKASDRHVLRTSAGLDESLEAARVELLEQCKIGDTYEREGVDEQTRAEHDAALRKASGEFFRALGATSPIQRGNRIDAMWDAIRSLDRYRGAER